MLKIPPYDPNYEAKATAVLGMDVEMPGYQSAHASARQVRRGDGEYPDGHTEPILRVPKYDFNWQIAYEPEGALRLPAGTRLNAVSHYDNSPNNPRNPDPSKEVHFGDQTSDEMMAVFMHLAFPSNIDPRMLDRRPSYPPKPSPE